MRRKLCENSMIAVILAAVTLFICMQSSASFLGNYTIGTDSGVFHYIAFAISKGEVVYKDCFDHKGPLLYLINYLGMLISYMKGIWLIEVLFMLGTVCGIYRIASMFCGKVLSCIAVFIVLSPVFDYFMGGNFSEEYAMPLILWSLYIFLDYFLYDKISKIRIIMCGVMFAGVVMLRANMVALWLIFCMAVLVQKLAQKRGKELPGLLGYFLAGCIMVFGPIIFYLCLKGAVADFIQNYLLFNLDYSVYDKGPKLISYMTFTDTYWMLVSLGVSLYEFISEKDRKKNYLYGVYFLFVISSLLLTCMSGIDYKHYGMSLLPVFTFPVALLLSYTEESAKENKLWYFVLFCCVIFVLPPWTRELRNIIYAHYYGESYQLVASDVDTDELNLVVETVLENSTSRDRITVWGNVDNIYVYTKRLSSSSYSYQFPLVLVKSEIYDEYFEDLEKCYPKIIVIFNTHAEKMATFRMQDFIEDHQYGLILETSEFRVYSAN